MEDSTIADALTTFRELINQGSYAEAHEAWRKMEGQVDGFTYWYNLGTIETLRKNYPEARYALERARHHTIYSDVTEHQLEKVHQALGLSQTDTNVGAMMVDTALAVGPAKLWFGCILLIVVMVAAINREIKIWHKAALLFVSMLPAIGLFIFMNSSIAFINFKPIPIYNGPSEVFTTESVIVPGERVLGWKSNEWIKIYSESGDLSWLKASDIAASSGIIWGQP